MVKCVLEPLPFFYFVHQKHLQKYILSKFNLEKDFMRTDLLNSFLHKINYTDNQFQWTFS